MSVHCHLMAPFLAPGQTLSGFLLQKVFKDKPHLRSTCARDSSYGTIVQESKGCQRGKGS